jgi:hypothetical protein
VEPPSGERRKTLMLVSGLEEIDAPRGNHRRSAWAVGFPLSRFQPTAESSARPRRDEPKPHRPVEPRRGTDETALSSRSESHPGSHPLLKEPVSLVAAAPVLPFSSRACLTFRGSPKARRQFPLLPVHKAPFPAERMQVVRQPRCFFREPSLFCDIRVCTSLRTGLASRARTLREARGSRRFLPPHEIEPVVEKSIPSAAVPIRGSWTHACECPCRRRRESPFPACLAFSASAIQSFSATSIERSSPRTRREEAGRV